MKYFIHLKLKPNYILSSYRHLCILFTVLVFLNFLIPAESGPV